MEKRDEGVNPRQRTELTLAALLPAALGMVGTFCSAGRLCWLGPLLALPAGLGICLLWRELGSQGLPQALETAFGRGFGHLAQLGYLLWALALLWDSAGKFARRLTWLLPGEEWFFLGAAAAVCLWLSRGREEIFARTGRLFFLTVAVTLAFSLALAAPGLDWRNLWPPERDDLVGVLYSALLSLSLTGYGVFTLCLPGREEKGSFTGVAWGSAALGWLLLTVVGIFGAKLAAELEEPFFMALQGVEVPGAFRRGEAALASALTLADFALLALLSRGCRSLWGRMTPPEWGWGGYALPALAVLAAGALGKTGGSGGVDWLPAGSLIFGIVLPALAVLGQKVWEGKEGAPIFGASKRTRKEDVGGNFTGKKSRKENQKKC